MVHTTRYGGRSCRRKELWAMEGTGTGGNRNQDSQVGHQPLADRPFSAHECSRERGFGPESQDDYAETVVALKGMRLRNYTGIKVRSAKCHGVIGAGVAAVPFMSSFCIRRKAERHHTATTSRSSPSRNRLSQRRATIAVH